jgi:beta-1,2-mannobiose phosphorylase / 1,2-beta-oligomannan phosphorylase
MTSADLEIHYRLQRSGIVMRGDPDDPTERLGVLNPAAARDETGTLYLFPRVVAEGNFSRIARAKVLTDADGRPVGVQRDGIVLEPSTSWEHDAQTGGVEDPRITRIATLDAWLMTYTAYGPLGPKIALAYSTDLREWHRLGPASFEYDARYEADFNLYPNKDAVLFPEPVTAPDGRPAFAMLHRPSFDLWSIHPGAGAAPPVGITEHRQSIWISFAPLDETRRGPQAMPIRYGQHRLLAAPEQDWENVKIGAGPPPMLTTDGWLLIYHGVSGQLSYDWPQPGVCYRAGAMLLDADDVTLVRWRSKMPLLEPETEEEQNGIVPNVVFPTALDQRPDGTIDVYFGMADDKIGVAQLTQVPEA